MSPNSGRERNDNPADQKWYTPHTNDLSPVSVHGYFLPNGVQSLLMRSNERAKNRPIGLKCYFSRLFPRLGEFWYDNTRGAPSVVNQIRMWSPSHTVAARTARTVFSINYESDRGRNPVLRDELAFVVLTSTYPRERIPGQCQCEV